jgi:small-conductance mechanosensitive channel
VGDRVCIGDTTGDITKKTLLVTQLRTPKNVLVSVPNSVVLSAQITNYSGMAAGEGLILHTSVTIGYDAPWRTVHELLVVAALRTESILADPAPFVLQRSLDDFFVTYEINAYTREANRMLEIYARLHANIQDAFNEAGVEIMSPHYRSVRDGNTIAIPAASRPPSYEAPAFRVATAQGGVATAVAGSPEAAARQALRPRDPETGGTNT